jgi:hypothetical protein
VNVLHLESDTKVRYLCKSVRLSLLLATYKTFDILKWGSVQLKV